MFVHKRKKTVAQSLLRIQMLEPNHTNGLNISPLFVLY